MKVENVKVYDLEESIIASGYPMRTNAKVRDVTEMDVQRCINLSNACNNGNGAHGQFLTGIRVSFDLTCSNKMWVEAERYRFLEFVSSQSTMHCITKFDLSKQYNQYVDARIIDIMKEKVDEYNNYVSSIHNNIDEFNKNRKQKYLEILYSNPAGFELTARLTTNYRCLKNIYIQRHDHRLPEWREFCDWMKTLPLFEKICLDGLHIEGGCEDA